MATIIFIFLVLLPFISGQNITFILEEDRPNGTLIGNILHASKLEDRFSSAELNGIAYDFYEIKDAHRPLFRLDSVSSNLYTNTIIDREKEGICKYLSDCYFDFKVLIHTSNGAIFEIFDTRVNVTDLNDNNPTFESKVLTLNLSEATTQYTKVPLASAIDLDTGKGNGVQYYNLTSISDFKLVEEVSGDIKALYLSVENELDRETTESYVMYLRAIDGGNPIRTGTLTININILDENDNKPEFEESQFDVNVDETAEAGTLVKHLSAKDKDSGKNGEVFYRLKSFQSIEINDSFRMDATTGKLTLAKALEYEEGKVYTVLVEAVDRGSIPLSAQATVNVHVQDIGNNAPVVSVNFLSNEHADNVVYISEKSDINFLVAVIKVKDSDSGKNGDVSCYTYSTYFGLSRISSTDYRLFVQHKLDRETMESHSVTVTCKDKGQPEMDDSVQFQIVLKDENDNPPRFSEYYYQNIELEENKPEGFHFFTVNATDADIGDNGNITYEIFPSTDERFVIDPRTGDIRTNTKFDRETTSQVVFQVVAKDHGIEQLESKTSVLVDIVDVNDNKPTFINMIPDLTISEGLPVGSLVDVVSAVDHDSGTNGLFTFMLEHNQDSVLLPFNISTTGEIRTKIILDRENKSHYSFSVLAVDQGVPQLTSTASFRINVLDKNDNKPIFIFPKDENNTVLIPSTMRDDSIIVTIQAYDVDYEENGNINFFIYSGDEENRFYLNPTTGSLHIKTTAGLKSTGNTNFNLKIEARDRGSPPLNETTDLKVVIQHVNTTTPKTKESKEYILISVSIVCVTFVCAVALIAVICFLRRKNIACGKENNYIENNRPPQYDQVATGGSQYPYAVPNNKQRVKFCEPGTTFTKQQMMDDLTLTKKDSPRKEKEHSNFNFDNQKPPEECETSSKTDSGHGSEEDFNQQIDKTGRPYSLNNQHTVPPYNTSTGIYMMIDKNKPNNTEIPRSNNLLDRLPSRDKPNKYLDDSLLTASLNSMWSDANPSSSRHPSHSQTSTISPSWTNNLKYDFQNNSPFYMALGSVHSRDDDGSTTTSGSYTINPDELDDEFSNRPKDLFV